MRLIAECLSLDRGGRRIVDQATFAVSDTHALLVVGPNGAGKSTLLRGLVGLLPVASGVARLEQGPTEDIAGAAHYLGHADGMKAALTARENLDFWAAFLRLGETIGLEARQALGQFGLAHVADFPVGYLSAGQKRRVALARLLVAPRPLWLLDEPTTALDARAQAALAEAMTSHRANGGIVVAATHAPLGLDDAQELRLGKAP